MQWEWERVKGALAYRLHRLAVTVLRQEITGPKVLLNSIPKSGTHLLVRCLDMFPNLRYCRRHVERRMSHQEITHRLEQVRPGYFASAHLTFTPERLALIERLQFATLLMIRDPRDLAVSHFHYVTYKDKGHRLYPHFHRLPDDHARLMASIVGVDPPGGDPSLWLDDIGERFRNYLLWERHGSLVVRFEHLVGPHGGGSREAQMREIRRVADHLGVSLDDARIAEIAEHLYHRRSRTFRRGLIGDWQRYFTPEHREAFKAVAGQLLIDLGYETDLEW